MISIGIDLGTTNSVASHVRGDQPVVIPNRDDSTLTPSVVSYRATGPSEGEFLVGVEAVRYANQAPGDTVYSVKRLMGLNYDTQQVREVAQRVPFTICPPPDASDIGARVLINGKPHTPIDVSAMILRHIKEDCEHRLGQPVVGAAVTVPAFFLDCQRNATKEAGEQAGFRLHPLLNEPVAASLAFGSWKESNRGERLLVYDLGGGTFDVAIVQIAGENTQVLKNLGDMWLGGDDFDQTIVERICRWISDQHGVEKIADLLAPGVDSSYQREAVKALRRIIVLAEQAKRRLSTQDSTSICEPFLMHHPEKGPISVDLAVARRDFEEDIRPKVDHSLQLVEQTMKEEGLKPEHLTQVVLVGGSTKVPLVRQALIRRFGESKVRYDIDPMHCVSLGAALWTKRFPLAEGGRIVLDRLERTGLTIPMDLGVEVFCDGNPHHFETIVPKNTPYPTAPPGRFHKTFYPTVENQRRVRIPVFQGNSSLATFNSCQGIIDFELPKGISASTSVNVAFEIDIHGNLTVGVDFEGHRAYLRTETIRRNQPVLSEKELERLSRWKEDLENMIAVGDRVLRTFGPYFTPEDGENLTKLLRRGREALKGDDRTTGQSLSNAIWLACIGSGTASDLFLAQRAQEMADTPLAREIARARVALERAHKEGNQAKVDEISVGLKRAVHRVFDTKRGVAGKGPLEGQLGLSGA